jgi:hypothetical protein
MIAGIPTRGIRRLTSTLLIAAAACGATAGLIAPVAQGAFTLDRFDTLVDRDGAYSRQAGAHTDFTTKFRFSLDEQVRDIMVDLPPGMVGNPNAADKCTMIDLVGTGSANCSPTSQVGIVGIYNTPAAEPEEVKVYNLVAPPNLPALLGFNYEGVIVRIEPRLRGSDYAIATTVRDIAQTHKISGNDLTLWAVPADPSHARLGYGCEATNYFTCDQEFLKSVGAPPVPDPAPRLPFLSNPTSCPSQPTPFLASVDSWQSTGVFSSVAPTADENGVPYLWDGCERLRFNPTVEAAPGSHLAAGPTGLDVDIELPQSEDPQGLATAHVRKTVVTLPKGFAISPSAASGLGACSPAQIGLGTNDPPTCPGSSQIGTVKLTTPLLEQQLEGEAILARQNENPFGSLLAMYLVIRGPGVLIKLPGKIEADPQTGQLTTTFDDLPQLPFEDLSLELRGGPKAPLVTPSACGIYNAQVSMTSWASSLPVNLTAPMAITEGCATGGFTPALHAGTINPLGGAFSPFTLRIGRNDGEQNLSRIQATLPEGLLARLAGVALCPDAAAPTGNCPAASQVGTTTVAAGPGETPVIVPEPGKASTAVYLAGPYKGAPYSLVVKVPAQAGPFDLGTVTVRNALAVDPTTARVTAKSDPLPQILEGIPIAYRDIRVEVSRNDFTLNPTSCDPMSVESTLASNLGTLAHPSAPFQAIGCGELGFAPRLSLEVSGATKRGQFPALKAVLKAKQGQANIGRAAVTLPHSEFLAQSHINTVCTRVQFAADQCPKGSIYGFAKATTPLLDKPLGGPVYLRSSSNPLPDLVADLHGAIEIELSGRIDSINGGIRTTFDRVPDAPVSKFVLTMKGGKKGLLENSTNLCAAPNRAKVLLDGQNGKSADQRPVVANSCGKAPKAKKKRG